MSGSLPLSQVLYAEYKHLYPDAPLDPAIANDLDKVIAALHTQERAALCISGGGVRSATFALGVIQGLSSLGMTAADSVLAKIDYLSTVSGGGYIGSWLSAWSQRSGGILPVIQDLRKRSGDKLKPEPEPVHLLRKHTNYLTPKLELLSVDTWNFFGMFFRNLSLRWVEFVSLLAGILAIPPFIVSVILWLKPSSVGIWIREIALILFSLFLLYLSITRPTGKTPPKSWFYGNKAFQIMCLLPLCLWALAMIIGHAWFNITAYGIARMMMLGAAITALFSMVYGIRYSYASRHQERDDLRSGDSLVWYTFKKSALEIVVGAASGALFGALVYWFLTWFAFPFGPMRPADILGWVNSQPPQLSDSVAALYVVLGVPLVLAALLVQATLFVGATGWFNEDFDLEWWGRTAAWIIIAGIAWIAVTTIAIYGPVVIAKYLPFVFSHLPEILTALAGGSGIGAAVLSRSGDWSIGGKKNLAHRSINLGFGVAVPIVTVWLLALIPLVVTVTIQSNAVRELLRRSGKLQMLSRRGTIESLKGASWSYKKEMSADVDPFGTGQKTLKTIEYPAIDVGTMIGLQHLSGIEGTPPTLAVILVMGPILLSLIASILIPANRFSIHALYRDRLIRAYLGASNSQRNPNPFTGFDANDNIPMKQLRSVQRPVHVINMAANLVGGESLGWQERTTRSFISTPLHCGSLDLGYRPTAEYGGPRGMTLGTAAAISGIAASRSAGYQSSPALGLILTLFNIRFGWWAGNPGPAGENTHHLRNPRALLKPLLAEAFSSADAKHPYIYLSDGGHFENLGLYEMVLRRCRRIIIIDASADEEFNFADFANAIRKIRIDLGIRVVIEKMELFPRATAEHHQETRKYCATGRILYSEVDGMGVSQGRFVYIKPVFYGTEPRDIYNYAMMNETFPHQKTEDHFSSESQFESYRALGEYVVNQICRIDDTDELRARARQDQINTVEEFIKEVEEYVNPAPTMMPPQNTTS